MGGLPREKTSNNQGKGYPQGLRPWGPTGEGYLEGPSIKLGVFGDYSCILKPAARAKRLRGGPRDRADSHEVRKRGSPMKFLSALLTQTSGSIGGATGASNRGGNYLRSRVAPVQPRTVSQQGVRATLSAISGSWRALSTTEIAGWNSLAGTITLKDPLGNSYKPSGAQLYTGLNTTLSDLGVSPITAPPAGAPSFPDLLGVVATATAGTPTFTIVPGIGSAPTGFDFYVRCTPQVSAGKSYFGKSAYRFIEHFPASAYASLNVEAAWVARFGPLIAGQRISVAVSLVQATSGFRSVEATNTLIIGA